ncbi:twitching motility protein PilT [Halobacteriales archaeon SW_8_65_20]|nr:MAG: twitching motility protein PilT [Halobacteriales archaeon SW_8_65_20]
MTPVATVLDTTVLSNYARSESTEWLLQTVPLPVTVPAVINEVERGIADGYEFMKAIDEYTIAVSAIPSESRETLAVITLGSEASTLAERLTTRLDAGEAHALALAIPDEMLATDDQAARTAANDDGIDVTGSLGILADGVSQQACSVATANT